MAAPDTQASPIVTAFYDSATGSVSYLVADPLTRRAAIIDSVLDFNAAAGRTSTRSADMIVDHVRKHDFSVDWHLETHVHADHLTAAAYLKGELGGQIAIGEHVRTVQSVFREVFNAEDEFVADGQQFDHLFRNGEHFRIGSLEAKAIHTPGHTPACLTYVIGATAFVGDTLFMPDYGTARCDFPGGDARTLYRSIQKIFQFPAETSLYMCHDYRPGGRPAMWQTTVAKERIENIHIHDGISEDAFVTMRTDRDKTLDIPVLLLPAVQVNMRAGQLPPAERNGVHYLKIPLNRF
jgi:glyoxylase-like metal-dependent hydrolase (beta-lactamase superfamily II)